MILKKRGRITTKKARKKVAHGWNSEGIVKKRRSLDKNFKRELENYD